MSVPGDLRLLPGQAAEKQECPAKTGMCGHLKNMSKKIKRRNFVQGKICSGAAANLGHFQKYKKVFSVQYRRRRL